MSELDNALDRLGTAVSNLIVATGQKRTVKGPTDATTLRISELTAERDLLRAQVDELRALRDEDVNLRAEAADAVKIALTDLRSLVASKKKTG
ncbi:MAG TPA: hypothetical protein VMY41_20030 [Thermohalobaculum sp.]|nr:hypothetical protein [Thermohalobaculum sp.]